MSDFDVSGNAALASAHPRARARALIAISHRSCRDLTNGSILFSVLCFRVRTRSDDDCIEKKKAGGIKYPGEGSVRFREAQCGRMNLRPIH